MKKLIMLVVVLAIVAPALGLEDVPPEIDTSGGVTTAVWDFATEPLLNVWDETTPPDCIEPEVGSYLSTIFDSAWEAGELTGSIWYSVEVPEGGSYFTLRGQVHMAEGSDPPAWVEAQSMDCVSTEVDGCRLDEPYEEIGDPEVIDNVAIFQVTMERGDIVAAGGFIQGGEFEQPGDRRYTGLIVDVIVHDTEVPPAGGARSSICFSGLPNPIVIDPNVMTVYETGETGGDFDVKLRNEPPEGATITVTVDPNAVDSFNSGGPSEDITILGSNDPNGTITLTFTATTGGDPCDPCSWTPGNCTDWDPVTRTSCWNIPQTIVFTAIDDGIAEPQETGDALVELQTILVSSSWPAHPTDANFVGEKGVTVTIIDNDQADILFELVGTGPIRETPVTLLEYVNCTYWYLGVCYNWVPYTRTIGVTLQVEPENDESPGSQGYVRIIVTNEGGAGNPPIMDPCLVPEHAHTPSDPNAIVFTSDGNPVPGVIGAVTQWDVPFEIVLLGNDDDELQADESFEDGDQFYNANLVFWVESTSDGRYTVWDEEDEEYYGMERSVDIEIEDNECGALGILPVDISNPYYLMDEETLGGDPNDWVDEDGNPMPDCHVDIYDVLEFVTEWLECSDPQGSGCTQYNL